MAKKSKARRLTPAEVQVVEACMKVGLSLRTSAAAIEWPWDTFKDYLKKEQAFANRLEGIASKTKVVLAGVLVEKARNGNLPALIYWLKTRTTEFREVILEAEIDDNVTANDFKFE